MNKAYFFLSTGRCGTQWMTDYLSKSLIGKARVWHEPLQSEYNSRHNITTTSIDNLPLEVQSHLENIDKMLAYSSYFECGHPSWGCIPALINHFGKSIKIIQIVRHPIPTAMSWLTHSAYVPPLLPHLKEKVLIAPDDSGVNYPHIKDQWANMSPFDKCIYYWMEINTFGKVWQASQNVPWLTIKFEEMFSQDGLQELHDFIELEHNSMNPEFFNKSVDQFKYITNEEVNFDAVQHNSNLKALCDHYGYNITDIQLDELQQRYTGQIIK